MILNFPSRVLDKLRFHYRQLFLPEEWNIGIMKRPIHTLLDRPITAEEVTWMPAPEKGTYYADPFALTGADDLQVYFEWYEYHTRLGRITRVAFDGDKWSPFAETALEAEYHLSYPFIATHGNKVYCIPETSANRRTGLYMLDRESLKLTFIKTLLHDTEAVDPTLFHYNGLWWLFCTLQPYSNEALHLYYAEEISGPYTAHPANPVKGDTGAARPAGTPFLYHGELFRPAQDSSESYGKRIAINRIKRLSPDEFEEEVVKRLEPVRDSRYNLGIHTISAAGDCTLIDGKRYRFVWDNFAFQLKRKFSKLIQRI